MLKLYGLSVDILKPDHDCTANGLSSKATRAILIGAGIPELFGPHGDEPVFELGSIRDHKIAIPVGDPRHKDGKHAGPMFGGNFLYTSDSRFPNEYPIPIHDRYEGSLR